MISPVGLNCVSEDKVTMFFYTLPLFPIDLDSYKLRSDILPSNDLSNTLTRGGNLNLIDAPCSQKSTAWKNALELSNTNAIVKNPIKNDLKVTEQAEAIKAGSVEKIACIGADETALRT